MNRRQNVLVIDDDPMIHRLVTVRLKPLEVDVACADNGRMGIAQAREQQPDLILLDVSMPEMDGFEVCRHLRASSTTNEIPVIFLTGTESPEEKVRAFDLGATDYVTKPFDAGELVARVRNSLRMQTLLEVLERQAHTDALTGLPNREAFRHALIRSVERARTVAGYRFALLFIDVDRFKVINDSLGHDIGDGVLVGIAERIHKCIAKCKSQSGQGGGSHLVARMGGDEFTILLDDIKGNDEPEAVARCLQEVLDEPYDLNGYQVKIGISVGIRLGEGDVDNADAMLRDSDTAMYHAKAAGRGRYVVFNQQMHDQAVSRLEMEAAICQAARNQDFTVAYQPIIVTETGELVGLEALLRWHPETSTDPIPPDAFIPIAEETGLIVEIGQWMLDEVCRQITHWHQAFPQHPDLWCSINISKVQCESGQLQQSIFDALQRHQLAPRFLKLEITESAIMHDMERIIPVLDELRTHGLEVAMDDFGTGYSSLSSLHRFPIDILKIDRSFVHNIDRCRTYSAIVDAIAMLAHNLNMKVVAEGIETMGQTAQIQALDCDYAQGYLFCKPMSADKIDQWINSFSIPQMLTKASA